MNAMKLGSNLFSGKLLPYLASRFHERVLLGAAFAYSRIVAVGCVGLRGRMSGASCGGGKGQPRKCGHEAHAGLGSLRKLTKTLIYPARVALSQRSGVANELIPETRSRLPELHRATIWKSRRLYDRKLAFFVATFEAERYRIDLFLRPQQRRPTRCKTWNQPMNSREAHFAGELDPLEMDTPRARSEPGPQHGTDRIIGNATWMFALLFICYLLAAAGTLSPRRGSSPSYITGFYLGVTVVIWASFCQAFFRKPAPKRRFAAFVAIFAALFGGHINRAQNGAQDARDANMPAVQEPVASRDTDGSTSQIPQKACLAFALAFERAIQSGDVKAANQLVDWDAIAHAATAGLGIPPQTRADFGRGVADSLRSGDKGLFAAISGQVTEGGSYRFLRVREIDGHPTVLFRLINESGLNYHEFLLQKQEGKLRAVDLLLHLSGEKLSATLRRTATPLAQQWTQPLLQRLTTAVPEYVRHFDKFGTLSAAVREKRHDEALEIYGSMPEALRQDKAVLLMRHQAAIKTSEEEVLRSIEDFRQYYPEDACLDFLLIDYYTLRGEYDQSLASIDRVDTSVGGDPYLNTSRSDILYAKGEAAKAFCLAEKAVADCPDLLDAHWTLLGLALLENDHERTLSTLTRIEQQFRLDLSGVDGSPEYEAFMQSSQGEKWARSHWQSTAGEKQ